MDETRNGLPVHDLAEAEIPDPDPGALHFGALSGVLGDAAAREVKLASRVLLLEETCRLLRLQVEHLKARIVAEVA